MANTDIVIHRGQIKKILAEDPNLRKMIKEQLTEKGIELAGSELEKAIDKREKTIIEEIRKKINRLKELMQNSEKTINLNLNFWRRWQSIGGIGTKENSIMYDILKEDIQEAFNIINSVAALLRGDEEIILRVSLLGEDGKVHIFEVPESDVKASVVTTSKTSKNNRKYTVDELRYSLGELKASQKEIEVSESFNNHYNEFFDISHSLIQTRDSFKNANEGHITEAFYVHFEAQHPNTKFSEQVDNDLDTEQVAKALWDSYTNKAGWWKAGDVANIQIKALNTRLASVNSIKVLANQLIYLFSQETFDWTRFKKVFTEYVEPIEDEIIEDSLNKIE